MEKVLGFLIRYFSNYYTLHRSDLAARAAPLDPRLPKPLLSKGTHRPNRRLYYRLLLKLLLKDAELVFFHI